MASNSIAEWIFESHLMRLSNKPKPGGEKNLECERRGPHQPQGTPGKDAGPSQIPKAPADGDTPETATARNRLAIWGTCLPYQNRALNEPRKFEATWNLQLSEPTRGSESSFGIRALRKSTRNGGTRFG